MLTMTAIAEKAAAGERLTDAEAELLLTTSDLTALGMLAEQARVRRHADRVTFVRVLRVQLDTNEPVHAVVPSGAGELRIAGAVDNLDRALGVVRSVKEASQGTPVTGFLLSDLQRWCDDRKERLVAVLQMLREAGLDSIAEAPLDGLPRAEDALAAVAESGLELARLTVTTLADDDRLGMPRRAARLQEQSGIIRSFAPLQRAQPHEQPTTGYQDVRQIALSRLLADNIETIQVDWSLHGPKLSQVALMFGADDLDAVPAVDTNDLGPRRTVLEEVRRNIRTASLEPVERNGRFAALVR